VAAIQNSVNAQNLIATDITKLTTAFGVAFPAPFSGSGSWTPGGIANGASATNTISVSGAVLGDYVQINIGTSQQGCLLNGYVSTSNIVTAVLANNTGSVVTFTATTLKARVTTV